MQMPYRYSLNKYIVLEIKNDFFFKKFGIIDPEETAPRITTSGTNNSYYMPEYRIAQRLNSMYRHSCLCDIKNMPHFFDSIDCLWWQASHSSTIDQTFSTGKGSEERAELVRSRTFAVRRTVWTIVTVCGRALSNWSLIFSRASIEGKITDFNTIDMQIKRGITTTFYEATTLKLNLRARNFLKNFFI